MALLSTDREGVVVKKNYNRIYWAGTDSSDSDDSNADYDSGNDVNSDIFSTIHLSMDSTISSNSTNDYDFRLFQ